MNLDVWIARLYVGLLTLTFIGLLGLGVSSTFDGIGSRRGNLVARMFFVTLGLIGVALFAAIIVDSHHRGFL